MSDSFATPWTIVSQAPLSLEFSRQEYWNGFPFSSPGDLPDPGIEPVSPALAGVFFTTELPGKRLAWYESNPKGWLPPPPPPVFALVFTLDL